MALSTFPPTFAHMKSLQSHLLLIISFYRLLFRHSNSHSLNPFIFFAHSVIIFSIWIPLLLFRYYRSIIVFRYSCFQKVINFRFSKAAREDTVDPETYIIDPGTYISTQ